MKLILGLTLLLLFVAFAAADAIGWSWLLHHRTRVFNAAASLRRKILATAPLQAVKRRFPRTWNFIGARLTAAGYLGIHFTVGLLLSIAALAAFTFVAYDVFRRERLVAVDREVITAVRGRVTEEFLPVFKTVTIMGNGETMLLLGLALLVFLAVRRKKALLIGWCAALLGGWLLESGLKLVFQRPRPSWAIVDLPSSFSFPSGHALVSLVAYGMIGYLLWLAIESHRGKLAVVTGAILLITLIGFSRVYLGVHYFSDVMAGYAAGLTWLSALVSGLEVVRRKRLAAQTP